MTVADENKARERLVEALINAPQPRAGWFYKTDLDLRFFLKDGALVLQQGRRWESNNGQVGGVDWADIPVVSE